MVFEQPMSAHWASQARYYGFYERQLAAELAARSLLQNESAALSPWQHVYALNFALFPFAQHNSARMPQHRVFWTF